METDKKSEPNAQNTNADYNPTGRDFQRTEEDIDNVSKSEKEELEERKENTSKASTTPNKNNVGG